MSSFTESVPSIKVMSTTKKTSRAPHDTGFPEPFNDGRTTTLRHPDADTSPNACISQEDVAPDFAMTHSRRSFLRRKNRHTLGHGRIKANDNAAFSSMLSLGSGTTEGHHEHVHKPLNPSVSSGRISRDGSESIVSHRDDETPPTSPDVASYRSKKGFLKKWRRE